MSSKPALARALAWMAPDLPLPAAWAKRTFQLDPGWQLTIALTLNLLSLAVPILMLQVYDRIIPHQSYGTLTMLLIGVGAALVFEVALKLMRSWLNGWAAATHEHAKSCAAMERFMGSDIDAFEARGESEHLQSMTAISRLREFTSGQALAALIDLPFAVVFFGLIAYLGGWLAMIPLVMLLLFALSANQAGQLLKEMLERREGTEKKKTSFILAALSGIHTVKSLGMEAQLRRRFEAQQSCVTRASYRVALASGFATILSAGFSQMALIATSVAGCLMVLDGQLSMGALSACTMLAGRTLQPVQRVMGTWLRLQDFTVARAQAGEIFHLPMRAFSNENLPVPTGRVVVENLDFAWPNGEKLFERVSFEVSPGEVIAISGDKGSGKSTLLQLVAGLLAPTGGEVKVDGINPAQYSCGELADFTGYLPQQGAIFRGTILENITGFRNEDEAAAIAKHMGHELGLDDVVDLLPRGYATMLMDTPADPVPPGVKQRIALVRVLKNMPAVLLFDDSDRTLDKEGYNRLFRLIGRTRGKSTIILVSHDQNLLSFSDRTYHLSGGRLTEVDNSEVQYISRLAQPMRPEGL